MTTEFEINGVKARRLVGYDNYAITENGEVWNMKFNKVLKPSLIGLEGSRYYAITLRQDGKSHCRYVHRLLAEAFVENEKNYKFAVYVNSQTKENVVGNLTWTNRRPRK